MLGAFPRLRTMAAQGPPAVLLGEPPDVTMEEAAAAAERPESENRSTAAIEPDERSDESESSELDDMEWLRHNDMDFEDWYKAHGDSAQPDELRARREVVERRVSEWEASPEGIALNAEVGAFLAKSSAAHRRSSNVGELELAERSALMFKVDNSGPVASGRKPAAKIVTKEQLHLAWEAIDDVAEHRGKQLSQSYGNFDKLWLLGDVMCGRLIDGDDAYRIGRRLGKQASVLKAEFDAPSRRVGKKKYANAEARECDRAAAAEEEAALRRETVDIGLEEEAAAIAAAAEAPAAPAGPSSEMPPPPPPPRPPPAPAPRNPERLERLKLLREAERLVSMNAEGALAAANRARDQAKVAWEHARERYSNPHRSAQIPEDRWAAWDK